jgi:thymidylate synthase (FAD)
MVNIIEPSIKILTPIDGDMILKHIEECGRTCYQSYGNKTEDTTSAKQMIGMLIKSGHESVLEHFSISVKMKVDVGCYKDLTRHRAGTAFSIESTRFCNYSKDKFDNQITFIKPCNIEYGTDEYNLWEQCMRVIEVYYNNMAQLKCKPDQLRMILPHSTAAEVSMTANLRAWRHIFKMRCAKAAHPSVRQIMLMTLDKFHSNIPVIFDDVYEQFKEDIQKLYEKENSDD